MNRPIVLCTINSS